jgi:hypothetical protein
MLNVEKTKGFRLPKAYKKDPNYSASKDKSAVTGAKSIAEN